MHIHTYIFNMRTLTFSLTWLCTERLRCSAREGSVGASTEAMSVLLIALLQHAVIDAVAAPQLQRLSCSTSVAACSYRCSCSASTEAMSVLLILRLSAFISAFNDSVVPIVPSDLDSLVQECILQLHTATAPITACCNCILQLHTATASITQCSGRKRLAVIALTHFILDF
jgi:hypothetical protein